MFIEYAYDRDCDHGYDHDHENGLYQVPALPATTYAWDQSKQRPLAFPQLPSPAS